MFVGEAPGADEDAQGEPFVGRAGQLLTRIIEAMGFRREDVYIANVLKCRPDIPPGISGNRKPTPEEMKTCLPWLEKQIELIKPRVMVALGATALEGLLGAKTAVNKLRGRWLDFHGIPVMPTYHPAYMIQHGMGAFLGQGSDPLVPGFGPATGWERALDSYLHCPAATQ